MTATDEHPPDEASVLSSLPGVRPQRRSPKRAAPKPDATAASEPTPATHTPQTATRRARPPRTRRPTAASEPADPDTLTPIPPYGAVSTGDPVGKGSPRDAPDPPTPPVAVQGFEAEPIDGTVNPPTGAELLASVAQGITEMVEIGLALTRRLAHSVLDRLPGL